MEEKDFYNINEVAVIINTSNQSIKNWYKWFNDDNYEKPEDLLLPEHTYGPRGTWMFAKKDIDVLKDFKAKLNGEYRGVMSSFNAHFWGDYGRKKLNKEGKGLKIE